MSQSIPEIQQVPARHGTATFVPKGHVIKIINTYGRQVVDTWAFALPKPPSQEEVDEQNEQAEQAVHEAEEVADQTLPQNRGDDEEAEAGAEDDTKQGEDAVGDPAERPGTVTPTQESQDKQAEQSGAEQSDDNQNSAQKVAGSETETDAEKTDAEQSQDPKAESSKAGWSSYLPSMSRARGKAPQTNDQQKKADKSTLKKGEEQPKTWTQYLSTGSGEKKSNKTKGKGGNDRTWGSYFPSGKSFSNYVPKNVSMSAFGSSDHRDPTKSYAEQLYDFSKTPVGAGALSAATGSGYAGTAYAAYQAYVKQTEAAAISPPMEYLSMSHTHSATNRLIPKVDDTLVSNLRQPMLTIIEDTAAVHDTVIAACDPQRYRELGVEKWEEHGSCAENLVLALKQINESAGLKGPKAVGADVTVNTAPQPLNLFMNIPFEESGELKFEAPKGKKGEYIRLRAERDVVVVMSACPQDILPINGGKCMAAHFVVQEPEKQKKAAPKRPATLKQQSSSAVKKAAPSASSATKKPQPVKQPVPPKATTNGEGKKPSAPAAKKPSQPSVAKNGPTSTPPTPKKQTTQAETPRKQSSQVETPKKAQPTPKPGRAKPKKLDRKDTPKSGTEKT